MVLYSENSGYSPIPITYNHNIENGVIVNSYALKEKALYVARRVHGMLVLSYISLKK